MKNKILLGKKTISINNKPYIIAEISANHKQNFKNAIKLIKFAKIAGADAIKLQTFRPEKITINSKNKDFIIKDRESPWYKKKNYIIYSKKLTHHGSGTKIYLIMPKILVLIILAHRFMKML